MKNIKSAIFFSAALLVSLCLLSSCQKSDIEVVDYTEANKTEIEKYISDNNLNVQETPEGLFYVIEKEGTGQKPNLNSQVTVNYVGKFTNNEIFDQSGARSVTFGLNRVIVGWQIGIPLIKEGGKAKLIIPSKLGYGNAGTRGIPGGAVLVFDVELITVQ